MLHRVIAIVHLNDAGGRVSPEVLGLIVGALRGVDDVSFDPEESVVQVLFDHDVTGLPDIVRSLEDTGLDPASVAL